MEPCKRRASPFSLVLILFLTICFCGVKTLTEGKHHAKLQEGSPVVEKDQRKTLLVNEFGEITAINVTEGHKQLPYHLQFITLEPNSLFLPVLLHAEMVFYVHTGSGKLTWADDGSSSTISLREGDVGSLREGSVFYIQSNLESERRKLRIYAMFSNTEDNTFDPSIGAYSRINELVKSFDKKIMQAAFKVPEDMIEAITNSNTSAIVHAVPEKKNIVEELETSFLKNFLGDVYESNSKKVKTHNIFDHDPDLKTENGWSITVTKKQLKSLKHTNIGFLMVHLSLGSILAPHWNPKATELSVVVEGKGMVRTVCGSGNHNETECENMRFKVKEGDAFVVPRFHPMAQMSFENETFVFVGFSTSAKNNRPQFLAGKRSVLHILDKQILAKSLGVSNTTVDQLLHSPPDSVIFGCCSCAEEEEKMTTEEQEKKREEEEARKEEEEEKKRDEEEARKKEEEEEEARKKEEERKREEEEAEREREREREEERKHKEEEAKREREREREEERKRKEEEAKREREREREKEAKREREREREEEARREQEKRERRRQEEEARKEAEAEEARKAAARREMERAEEARREQEKREREEEIEKQKEKRERRRQEEEARREAEARKAAARREMERAEEEARREQEKRERRRQEEEARREAEAEQARRAAAAARREKEARREAEESAESEQEQAEREQEMRERRRQEEDKRQEEQEGRAPASRRGDDEEETTGTEQEQEQAERQQKQRERRRQEEEQREGEIVPWRKRGERIEKGETPEDEEEERERTRDRDSDNEHIKSEYQSHRTSFKGRRVLKMGNV